MIVCTACGWKDYTRVAGWFCRECQAFKAAVCTKVSYAVRKGVLPPAKTLNCVRCGKVAREYDHRDYSKPLDVKPMCRTCNGNMPPGLMPQNIMEINAAARIREQERTKMRQREKRRDARQRAQQIGKAAEKQE